MYDIATLDRYDEIVDKTFREFVVENLEPAAALKLAE